MSVIEKLDEVAGLIAEGHWTGSGHAWRLIRDHGPAIRQDMIDAERYRWLKEGENDSEVLEFNTLGNTGPDDVWLPRGDALDSAIDAARANRLAHYAALARATGEGEGHD